MSQSNNDHRRGPEGGDIGTAPRKRRLGEILVEAGVVTEAQVTRALAVQEMGGGRMGGLLVKLKFCTETEIRNALEEQLGVTVIELETVEIDPEVLDLVPLSTIRKYQVLPIQVEDDRLWLAMIDPYNLAALDDVRFATGFSRHVIVTCSESEFNRYLDEHFDTTSVLDEIFEDGEFYERALEMVDEGEVEGEGDDDSGMVHDLQEATTQHPVIVLVNYLLVESIRRRVSDIHIEPYETYFRIRVRIDGRLQTMLTPPQRLHRPVIARCKVMSHMDIAKRRIPQDGHISIIYEGETVHYRVSTLPTVFGEKCVIRLLKKDASLMALDTIGLEPKEYETVARAISQPQGLILVTGPTGSGKTTTLHASLIHINKPEVNIVTLEDPVEATLPDINHVKIDVLGGVTFSSGLRSILRQDPDIVFVGEMRDKEVSQIALRAALTGHMVLSTLHTNSAAESVVRLEDMGVPGFMLASALVMVIAQRLVRRVCPDCAEVVKLTAEEISEFHITEEMQATARLLRGKGCKSCAESGYRGRAAVYEILRVGGDIKELIRTGTTADAINDSARADGMLTLYDAGVLKVLKGITTFDEVRRVLAKAEW